MIYLITVHDRKKRLSNVDNPEQIKTHVWKSINKLTIHKTVLYPIETFNAFQNKALENRVNIVFSYRNKKLERLSNVLTNNNIKDIVSTFGEKDEDIYVLGTSRTIVERFAKYSDYIIDYTTEELGYTVQSIFDSINFADYNLLKKMEFQHFDIRYFVREKTNFIGY